MSKHRFIAPMALVFWLAPAVALAERSAQEWLAYMSQAMQETTYSGTFVYRYGDRIEAMRIARRVGSSGVRERLITLNGRHREILRDGNQVTGIFADQDAVVVDRRQARNPLTDLVPDSPSGLNERYELDVAGESRVADRDAVWLRIRPRDGYRYGYQMAIDRRTGLLLAANLVGDDGDRPIEQILFTTIETRENIPDSELQQSITGDGFIWRRRDTDTAKTVEMGESGDWEAGSVPDGFQVSMRQKHQLPGRDVMVEHWLYTDGLATVSVYIEKTGTGVGAFHGRSRMGALNVYGRTLGRYQVVVVGEVPPITVESIGRSIQRRDGVER